MTVRSTITTLTMDTMPVAPPTSPHLATILLLDSPRRAPAPAPRSKPKPKVTLQRLPIPILQMILRHTDSTSLRILFSELSLTLSRIAYQILMERLAQGNSAFQGLGEVDLNQVSRALRISWAIRGGEGHASATGSKQNERRGIVGSSGGEMKRLVAGKVHCPKWDAFSGRLPNEIMLQILEGQSYTLLKGLLTCGSAQLQKVAEATLWKMRCGFLETCTVKARMVPPGAGLPEQRYLHWPVSELGERYLDRKFVLVNDRGRIEDRASCGKDGVVHQELKLGSYWKVVCVDVDDDD